MNESIFNETTIAVRCAQAANATKGLGSLILCPNATTQSMATSTHGDGRQQELIFYIVTTVVVGLAMIGIGATVHYKVLWKYLKNPKAYLVGVISQITILPLLAWALARIFAMPEGEALAVFIQGCSPGGTTSNIVVYWIGGAVDLSVAMTCTTTLLALGMMPFWLFVYEKGENLSSEFRVPFRSLGIALAVLVVPLFLGMVIRAKARKKKANIISKVLIGLASIGILALLIARGVLSTLPWTVTWRQGVVACLMPLFAYIIGYQCTTIPGLNLSGRSKRTIAVEVALQNVQIASAVIQISFANSIRVLYQTLLFPLLYYVFQVGYSLLFIICYRIGKKKGWVTDDDESEAPIEEVTLSDLDEQQKQSNEVPSTVSPGRDQTEGEVNPTYQNNANSEV